MAKHVALLIETSNAYARGLLRGIHSFVQSSADWSLYLGEQRRGEAVPAWLKRWKGDGIIARIETPEIAQALQKRKLPIVDVSAARCFPEMPYVETDDREFATMAADHLLGRGFRNLGFSGDPRFMWSRNRQEAFVAHVDRAGAKAFVHETGVGPEDPAAEHERLIQWLKELPKPVGIMACYDIRGREILDACREAKITVPHEVAVIGVDNDELICDLSYPPLSSVIPDTQRTGYEAAQLLERMMRGEHVPAGAHLVPPLGIATRQSSDILAVDDEVVAAALRYIHDHALEGINVDHVVKQAPVSRRALETRFREVTGRTPHQEIVRVQIDRVKQLLANTDLTLEAIAHRCGFQHAEYMSVAFKREVKMPPGQFRARLRP